MTTFDQIQSLFRKKWGFNPTWVVRCPGRVNLIGEHVDYSDYSVLPMALEESTFVALGPWLEPELVLESIEPERYPSHVFRFRAESGPDLFASTEGNRWHNYFLAGWRGILEHLAKDAQQQTNARPKGMCALVGSTIPPSAGLSSSSALVCAASLATLVHQTGETRIPRAELAEIATHSERWVGTEGGGMDQACECLAEHGSALRIDFRPLKPTPVRLPESALFAVLHSGTEHRLAEGGGGGVTSHYNERVVECRLAAQLLAKHSGKLKTHADWHNIRTLKQAAVLYEYAEQPVAMIQWVREHLRKDSQMSPHTRAELCELLECSDAELAKHSLNASTQWMQEFWLAKRAEHVYNEAARVFEFQRVCDQQLQNYLGEGQALRELALLMNASHKSCRELFECSCGELDWTVAKCMEKGCIAARLTGAGWGGCVVALVEKSRKAEVEAAGLDVLFWSEPSSGIEAIKVAAL